MVEGINDLEGELTPSLTRKEARYLKNLYACFFNVGIDDRKNAYTATELVLQGRCKLLIFKLKDKNKE